MPYTRGRIILVLLIILAVHAIVGAIGYVRIFRLSKDIRIIREENEELTVENRLIENIIKEFNEVQSTSQKIVRAFSGPLGLNEQESIDLETLRSRSAEINAALRRDVQQSNLGMMPDEDIPSGLYFLTEKSRDYYDPEYLPTRLPVEGVLTAHFQEGAWLPGGSHYGIDIATTQGSHIRAAGAGVILLADWTPDFGNVIVISHGNGLYSYYAHAMRLLVEQGFRVRKGQPIALLGSSGISSAPHLHFEIWKDGQPLDPEQFLYALPGQEVTTGTN
jgi:murein DD-endopeptidase MepM/ murein hydrolase activator NlpD